MSERKGGMLLHISSLPGEYGIGDMGSGAYRFVDFLHAARQSCWQILPINPTDPISEHSPYSSSSAFAANILFISPDLLVDEGVLEKKDIKEKPDVPSATVDYDTVAAYKTALYHRAYQRFVSERSVHRSQKKEFTDFVATNAFWLEDYALFVTIKEFFGRRIWTKWPKALRERERGALQAFTRRHKDKINRVKFLQYLFFKQWDRLKGYCTKKNIRLIGDMPIYMDLDSVDVWMHSRNYKLDGKLQPAAVAGVPPDYFSDTGQRWGNPVYNWEVLKSSQFSWWVERFKFNFKLFNMVRIDHFRGLVQCWEIPAQEQTAINGKWADVPTEELLETLERHFLPPLPVIAEDLGYITDDVREVMRRFSLPGMKVLLFAFNGDMKTHPYLPHNYEECCVVYTGTHDNNTVLGWFRGEATQKEIKNVQNYIGENVSADNIHWRFIRMAFGSRARLAMIPMQDILGIGSKARMNRPATTDGNWRWRVHAKALDGVLAEKLSKITVETQRG